MLYDNAQLISAYAHAFQITGDSFYLNIAEETAGFCKRELKDYYGGYHASLDADSEGEEGKFYVWSIEEIEATLPESDLFKKLFGITYNGNWEDDKNILARQISDEAALEEFDLTKTQLRKLLTESKRRLFEQRSKRVRPGLDDKVLSSWNALMISGLADLYRASGKESYREEAIEVANFLRDKQLQTDGRLFRVFKANKSSINAYLDDYAFVMKAYIDLYEITFDEAWLTQAELILKHVFQHFQDEESPMFFYTSNLDPALAARKKESSDNVIPSSNSVLAESLWRLGHLLTNDPWVERSKSMVNAIREHALKHPGFYAYWVKLAIIQSKPYFEVAISGENAQEYRKKMQFNFSADRVFLGKADEESQLELLKGKFRAKESLIYVCVEKACKYPTHLPEEALSQMQS
jgi:hypothetical protein